jgi:hypothetical protein
MTATPLLRPGALEGRAVVAGGVYAAACAGAGAVLVGADAARVDLLVVDAAEAFGDGGVAGLRTALDGAWSEVRGVAERRWLTFLASAGGEYFSGCRFDPR